MSNKKLEKKFGQSAVFVASTLLESGDTLKSANATSLLKEVIHVISCGYGDKKEWGNEVHIVATPDPDPTQLASPNRNPGDARLILFIYIFITFFFFQKCRNLNP